MFQYRVTKYDPALRSTDGTYTVETWTSAADIGRTFQGQTLTQEDYLTTESRYIHAVEAAIRAANPSYLHLTDREINDLAQPPPLPRLPIQDLIGKLEISRQEALIVSRAVLREIFWARIRGDRGFYVFFGWDYYMYLGGEQPGLADFSAPDLFVEEYPAPLSD